MALRNLDFAPIKKCIHQFAVIWKTWYPRGEVTKTRKADDFNLNFQNPSPENGNTRNPSDM